MIIATNKPKTSIKCKLFNYSYLGFYLGDLVHFPSFMSPSFS